MSIQFKILGKPGRDNALFVWINTGTQMYRVLFDCGESIFKGLKQADVKAIDYLFFSHLHIDHVAGFDYYFRRNFDRIKPNYIWGPLDTSEIIHNRLRGFKWNLISSTEGEFAVTDILPGSIVTNKYITSESFTVKHVVDYPFVYNSDGNEFTLIDTPHFTISAILLNHIIPVAAYKIAEKESLNISKEALEQTGLKPGSWLEKIRDLNFSDTTFIDVDNQKLNIGLLRSQLLRTSPGKSICYLTDFIADDESHEKIIKFIDGTDIVICESQYHHTDIDLAIRNYHLTSRQSALYAKQANVKKLILFHLSERYTSNGSFNSLLEDARSVFPDTYFPEEWE